MKNTTIKDLALELGVSKSTVSRALRDSWEISQVTKDRVNALAKKMDYNPNPIALNLLKSQGSKDIGVIVPDISNPFFAIVIAGIEDVAFSEGFHILIYQSHDDYDREVRNVQHIQNRRKDGLLVSIAFKSTNYDHFKHLHEKGFPIVFFDRTCDEIDTHKVSVDDFEGAYKATEHLVKQGCKHIAHITGPKDLLISKNRLHGYRSALLDYKIPIDEKLIFESEYNTKIAKEIVLEVLKKNTLKIDAIFASSDNIAVGCHSAMTELGLNMPNDIALIGFSDLPIASLLNPPMSSVAQPAFEMGRSAAKLLIDLIRNPDVPHSPITNVLKTELVIRKSSLKKEF